MVLRNFLGVMAGLLVAFIIITLGITINKSLFFPEMKDFVKDWRVVYGYWEKVIKHAHYTFFIALLFSAGLGSFFGGIVTSFFVKKAKVAYALLIGLILVLVAWFDIIITIGHPNWYVFSLTIIIFSFAWVGGKVVEMLISKV